MMAYWELISRIVKLQGTKTKTASQVFDISDKSITNNKFKVMLLTSDFHGHKHRLRLKVKIFTINVHYLHSSTLAMQIPEKSNINFKS